MTQKRFVVLFVTIAIVAAATFGAGWKWGGKGREGFGHERLAGWTWDAGVVPDSHGNSNDNGNSSGNANGHETNGDPTP